MAASSASGGLQSCMYWIQVPYPRRQATLPMGRTYHSVVEHNNCLWIFGGMSHQHSTPLGIIYSELGVMLLDHRSCGQETAVRWGRQGVGGVHPMSEPLVWNWGRVMSVLETATLF